MGSIKLDATVTERENSPRIKSMNPSGDHLWGFFQVTIYGADN